MVGIVNLFSVSWVIWFARPLVANGTSCDTLAVNEGGVCDVSYFRP